MECTSGYYAEVGADLRALTVNVVLPLISAFVVAHKIPLLVKVYCSGIVSRVVGLLHRPGFKGAYLKKAQGNTKFLTC